MNNIPEKCLARIFPNGFEDFYTSALEKILSLTVYTQKKDENESITASAIAFIFYTKFENWSYLGSKQNFLNEFISELIAVILEIRKKEFLWNSMFHKIEELREIKTKEETGKQAVLSRDPVEKIITERTGSDLGSLGRILNNFDKSTFNFSDYYKRFYPLFNPFVAISDTEEE